MFGVLSRCLLDKASDVHWLAALRCVRCVVAAVSAALGHRRILPSSSAVCSVCCRGRGVYCTRSHTYTVWQLCGVFAVSSLCLLHLSHRCSLPGSSAVCSVCCRGRGVYCTRSQTYTVWQLCTVTVDSLCVCVRLLSLNKPYYCCSLLYWARVTRWYQQKL